MDRPRILSIMFGVIGVILLGVAAFRVSEDTNTQSPYIPAPGMKLTIEAIAHNLGPVVRLTFTPDGKYLLVGRLTGELDVFRRDGETWHQQPELLAKIETAFPGFPPDENGLTGLAFGADYGTSGDLFVTYAFRAGESDFRNRVARLTVTEEDGSLTGTNLTQIFEANVPTDASHQIQAIAGVMVEDQPHALFQLGEGFKAERALDTTQEAGKLMLIGRDGSDPLGVRPFPAQPKLQAIGLRNPPDLAFDSTDPDGRWAIVDTGPDDNDRFLYGNFLGRPTDGLTGMDFGWDGTDSSLRLGRADVAQAGHPDSVLYRWAPTHTATNIVFHPGKGSIPASTAQSASVLVSLFGRTGLTGPGLPGREIWLGRLDRSHLQPTITWQPLIIRSKQGIKTVGHPIGLARDPVSNDLVFADIMDGTVYWVHL